MRAPQADFNLWRLPRLCDWSRGAASLERHADAGGGATKVGKVNVEPVVEIGRHVDGILGVGVIAPAVRHLRPPLIAPAGRARI